MPFYALDGRALIDGQQVGQGIEQLQRVKLRLAGEAHRAADAQRQRQMRCEGCGQAEGCRGLRLAAQGVFVRMGV